MVNHVRRNLILIMLTGQHITGDIKVGHLRKTVNARFAHISFYFSPCKYGFQSYFHPLIFSIHYWYLPFLIITVGSAKWWLSIFIFLLHLTLKFSIRKSSILFHLFIYSIINSKVWFLTIKCFSLSTHSYMYILPNSFT